MAMTAAYLNPDPNRDARREPLEWGPDASRRARAVEIYTALRHLGRQGVADIIARTCTYAERFATVLEAHGYQILNDVVLNQVLVFFGSTELTARIIQAIQADGTCWCGRTVWHGRPAMRISVSSWATTEADVHRSLDAILAIASRERAS